jgi:hypothetical protein
LSNQYSPIEKSILHPASNILAKGELRQHKCSQAGEITKIHDSKPNGVIFLAVAPEVAKQS